MRKIDIGGTEFQLGCVSDSRGIVMKAYYVDSFGNAEYLEEVLGELESLQEEEVISCTQKGLLALEQQVHELVSGQNVKYDDNYPDYFVGHVVQFGLPVGKEGILEQLTEIQ